MIRITKSSIIPPSLSANATTWKTQLLAHIANGEDVPAALAKAYNQDDVKAALRSETNDKCIYCESKIAHVAPEHIEHIKPKAKDRFPELTFEWTNLGLACPQCNMNKGHKYDAALPFINPYEEEPSDHFYAAGPLVFSRIGNDRAKLTERIIELNRAELIERRKERLDTLRLLFDSYSSESNPSMKNVLRAQIEEELANDKEYTFCARTFSSTSGCP